MDDHGRQRWVGALLLVLLVLILAPLVLRSPDEVRVALDMSMPAPPEVQRLDIQPVNPPNEVARVEQGIDADRQSLDEQTLDHDEAVKAAVESGDPSPPEPPMSGWAVQVASFNDRENASNLALRLREANYNAFVREVRQDDSTFHRVLAGPELQRERAEGLRQRLQHDQAFALEGLVVPLTID